MPMNNSTGNVHQTGCTGNCLATVYLANSTTSTSKLPMRNLAFSQSMPFERMTNSAIKRLRYGSSENASQLQQTSATGNQYNVKVFFKFNPFTFRTETSNDKLQRASLSSTESIVSRERVTSKVENFQPNKISYSKSLEELNSNRPKVATCSMSKGGDVLETPNSVNNSRKASDSTSNLNHLLQNNGDRGEEIVPEDVIIQNVNSIQVLSKYSNNEEFTNGTNGSEAEGSSEYSVTELVSGQNSSQTIQNAGSSSHTLPVPSETFEQIRSEHKMLGRLFCDPSFPADESSLYYSRRPPCSIVWMRPPEIVSAMCRTDVLGIAPRKIHYPEFIADGNIRLGDLRQGELGKHIQFSLF
ncbi:unnamed protein product [Hymenolepis diminuta]|uniref:Calpain catalytic domain-containing protein n=1 Tax=Hymenolepis diminuta TaxID=6216 RepID=A0A3P6WKK6_HYMDI|nr:unnamed protein product [Hymenolepis diminuta]